MCELLPVFLIPVFVGGTGDLKQLKKKKKIRFLFTYTRNRLENTFKMKLKSHILSVNIMSLYGRTTDVLEAIRVTLV